MDPDASSSPLLPSSLEEALIPILPPCAYYIPNFITPAEEAHLLRKINNVPLPTWRTLSHRRLQAHPSPLTATNTLLASPLPAWLSDPVIPRLLSLPLDSTSNSNENHLFAHSPHRAPNHVLINEYHPGEGILPHEDGAAYHPIVATVSLGAPIVFDIHPKEDKEKKWRILQERRSLLVTMEEVYEQCMHGIEGLQMDKELSEVCNWDLLGDKEQFEGGESKRETRVSLTFRDVIRMKKLGKGFEFLGK